MKTLHSLTIRWTVLALLLVGVWIIRLLPGAGEAYARMVYPWLSVLLSGSVAWIPISLCEMLVIGSGLLFCSYPFYARRRKLAWRRIIGREIELLLWIYVWFYWGWGMNYFRDDFFSRSSLHRAEYQEKDFRCFLSEYAESLNTSYHWFGSVDKKKVEEEIKSIYGCVPAIFGLTRPRTFQHPKFSLVNGLYSKVGVLGYMGPFFAESHVNRELLPWQYPFVYAHELSHLLGVSSEAEANFWAYQICIRSSDPKIRYSGYMGLLPYVLSNVRAVFSEKDYREWIKTIRPEVMRQLAEEDAYWNERYSRLLGEVQSLVYDWYLKGNRISSGQKNYGEVVGMVLSLPEEGWAW